ncbi:MAG TPA: TonB-dependent receptor, partial [Terriglobales bacterium]|nr:TonB-dependent receptor [Terriglobales bacterium]
AFDRADYKFSDVDSVHLNLGFTRSWFQNPNSFDNLNIGVTAPPGNALGLTGLVGPTDQRSQIKTFNIAPSWTRLLSSAAVFTFGAFIRRDEYSYYPSHNPFADLSPNLQLETVSQYRTLTNAGVRSDVSYVKGIHTLKAGVTYEQTFLTEHDRLGIVDPTLLPVTFGCPNGQPAPDPCAVLPPFDLTRPGGRLFFFPGHTDVKELALYVQDSISKGPWSLNLGIRGDLYNGLSTHGEAEPRLGVAYNIKKTNTVLRASYARIQETPFNENLVVASTGCNSPVLSPLLSCSPGVLAPLSPGFRNEFHTGLQQAFGKYLVFSGDYIWKYTHNGYDFSDLGNTPIFFPIAWHNSKITGFAGRVSVPNFHGFTALMVFSSVAARFFFPQVGGAGAGPAPTTVFRIDHDEKFNQTTHLQYQPWRRGPWVGFNWRYDSGLVAGKVPFADSPTGSVDLLASGLTADQEFQAGLFCGSARPAPPSAANPAGTSLPTPCLASQFGSTLVQVPAPGTQNDDHNPARIASRNLFDLAVGHDNIFHGDRYKWSARFTVINLTNKTALYNFLSTFSGTHYVTPRALTAQIGFSF